MTDDVYRQFYHAIERDSGVLTVVDRAFFKTASLRDVCDRLSAATFLLHEDPSLLSELSDCIFEVLVRETEGEGYVAE